MQTNSLKSNWPKLLSIVLFISLFTAYVSTFATFSPGETLNPNCAPGAVGCSVSLNVFNPSITTPLILGGSTPTSSLTLQSTSTTGITGADIHFKVGNNGSTEAMTILNNGNVGVGVIESIHPLTNNSLLAVGDIFTDSSMREIGIQSYARGSATTGNNTLGMRGLQAMAYVDSPNTQNWTGQVTGIVAEVNSNIGATGTADSFVALSIAAANPASGFIVSNLYGIKSNYIGLGGGSGQIIRAASIAFPQIIADNSTQLLLGTLSIPDGNYGIYESTSYKSYFSGNIGIGITNPTAYLNLKAGTITAGTAPLKFTSGPLLTASEAGAVEYDGSHLYFTATAGGTRYQLDQQGGLTSDADFNTKGGTNAGLNLVAGAQYNTFIGYEAGKLSAGLSTNNVDYNTAVGYQSLYSNIDGFFNTANGYQSLFSNTTGFYNTSIGNKSLYSNISGSNNTAIGNNSLYSNTLGEHNSAYGESSLYFNTIGTYNTAYGAYSMYSNISGSFNSAQGINSLRLNTLGSYNTAQGFSSGQYIANGSTANTTGSNSVFLGSDTKAFIDGGTNEIVIGYDTTGNGSNTTTIGTGNVLYVGGISISTDSLVARFTNNSGYCDVTPVTGGISCSSDINLKKNIKTLKDIDFTLTTLPDLTNKSSLDKLIYLTPVKYNWKSELDTDSKHIGFIAQEMEQVFPDLVSTDPKTNLKSISYANITPYLVDAIVEMNLKITDLSSLDTSKATSLVSMVKNFLIDQSIIIRDLTAGVFHINGDVCVDDVCISKDKFKQMIIEHGGVSNIPNSNSVNNKVENVINPTPIDNNSNTTQENTNTENNITSTIEDNTNVENTNTEEPVPPSEPVQTIVPEIPTEATPVVDNSAPTTSI